MDDASTPPTPQQTADAVRERLFAADRASRGLGMRIVAMAPGAATLAMTVRDDMLNGHGTCHGGFVAALADSAFAFACNSHGEPTVAAGFTVDFIAPGRAGDVLTARCAEVARAGRTGIYDAEVTNQRGERIAVFRGRSHTLRRAAAAGEVATAAELIAPCPSTQEPSCP